MIKLVTYHKGLNDFIAETLITKYYKKRKVNVPTCDWDGIYRNVCTAISLAKSKWKNPDRDERRALKS
jgi:hypothetical protein